jgi:pimeloyl-ACP methyl ester carboxylesterase
VSDLQTRSADGTSLAIHDLGGDGTPVLAVHGAGLCGAVFRPLARALGDRAHVFALDLRGHGASGVAEDHRFEWIRLAEDVLAALGALRAEGYAAPLGVVHSAGGTASLRAEALAPGSFASMYCYEPVLRTPEMRFELTTEHPLVAQALRRKPSFASRAEAYERYRPRPPFDTITDEALWAYLDYGLIDQPDGTVALACKPEYEAAIYLAGVRSDLYDHTAEITCPVSVAFGSAPGNELGRSVAGVFSARMPKAHLIEFPHLGHLGPLEDPEVVAASIIADHVTTGA